MGEQGTYRTPRGGFIGTDRKGMVRNNQTLGTRHGDGEMETGGREPIPVPQRTAHVDQGTIQAGISYRRSIYIRRQGPLVHRDGGTIG